MSRHAVDALSILQTNEEFGDAKKVGVGVDAQHKGEAAVEMQVRLRRKQEIRHVLIEAGDDESAALVLAWNIALNCGAYC